MKPLLLGLLLSLFMPQLVSADTAPIDPTAPTDPRLFRHNGSRHDSAWLLNSTLVGQSRRIAIINGTAVQEGDRIGDARVVRIRASEVQLQTPRYLLTLQLFAHPFQTTTQP